MIMISTILTLIYLIFATDFDLNCCNTYLIFADDFDLNHFYTYLIFANIFDLNNFYTYLIFANVFYLNCLFSICLWFWSQTFISYLLVILISNIFFQIWCRLCDEEYLWNIWQSKHGTGKCLLFALFLAFLMDWLRWLAMRYFGCFRWQWMVQVQIPVLKDVCLDRSFLWQIRQIFLWQIAKEGPQTVFNQKPQKLLPLKTFWLLVLFMIRVCNKNIGW